MSFVSTHIATDTTATIAATATTTTTIAATAVTTTSSYATRKRGRTKDPKKTKKKVKKNKLDLQKKKEIKKRCKQEAEAFVRRLRISTDAPHQRVFELGDAKDWKKHLNEHGYVMIKVLNREETAEMVKVLYQDLGLLGTGITRNDPSSHINANWPGIGSVGITKDPASGLAHSRFMWNARQAMRKVFESFWGTKELITSFDGIGMFRNFGEPVLKNTKTKRLWPHVDQGNKIGSHFFCAQGFLNLLDANERTGGLVVARGSHRHHAELMQIHTKNSANYLPLDLSDSKIQEFIRRFPLELVCAPAGSVVLWDSRLVHSNTHSIESPRAPDPLTPSLLRAVAYVTLMPRSRETKNDRDVRQRLFAEGAQTNHWSTNGGMKPVYLAYPRHRSFKPMQSAALTPKQIKEEMLASDMI